MFTENSKSWDQLALYSLFKNPFLLPSLAAHLLAFYLLSLGILWVKPQNTNLSIPIRLLEVGEENLRSIGPRQGPGGPRTLPKLGRPEIPRQSTGKLDRGSPDDTTPSSTASPAPEVPPSLPQPKVLADVTRPAPMAASESSPDSLVQLPTRGSDPKLAAALKSESIDKGISALKGEGDGEGIRALKEGLQIPGGLKGGGTGTAPYGVPVGRRDGKGVEGGGSGIGRGGGGSGPLSGPDLERYIKMIERRAKSVWRYPEGMAGNHLVYLSFALDRAGKLLHVKVLDSTDPRLNTTALEAMKRASPFPPIPETLKEQIAGEELRIGFRLELGVIGAR